MSPIGRYIRNYRVLPMATLLVIFSVSVSQGQTPAGERNRDLAAAGSVLHELGLANLHAYQAICTEAALLAADSVVKGGKPTTGQKDGQAQLDEVSLICRHFPPGSVDFMKCGAGTGAHYECTGFSDCLNLSASGVCQGTRLSGGGCNGSAGSMHC